MSNSIAGQLKSAARTTLNFSLIIIGLLLLLYLFSGSYTVANNERGVLLRFGKIVESNVPPGFHFAFPRPIDQVYKVPFPKVESVEIMDFSDLFPIGDKGHSFKSLTGVGSYLISGDNNLVNLECVLRYEVVDPAAYLFHLGERVETSSGAARRFLIEMACHTLVHCLARMGVDDILTNWDRIVTRVKKELQARLDELNCGLAVTFVEIKALNPPRQVQSYFDDVINAKIDRKRTIDDAESYRNQEIPAARGRAERIASEAEAHYNEVVQKAEGETERFLKQLSEYRKNPTTNRRRLYNEAMKEVFGSVGRLDLIDSGGADAPPVKIKLMK